MAEAKKPVFTTSLVIREGSLPTLNILECLVARPDKDGLWQVKLRSCSLSPNGNLMMHPPREKAVIVPGHIAYAMLKNYEESCEVPEKDKGWVPEGAQYFTQMEEIARAARLEAAEQAHGTARKAAALRRRPKPL